MKTGNRNGIRPIVSTLVMTGLVLAGCGRKEKEEEVTTNADGSTKLTEVKTADQLGVSTALGKISIPAAYKGASSKLLLTASKKSSEACMIGDGIKSAESTLKEIGGFFCHIEVEKAKIEFGKKYTITSKGQEFAKIWIDNSNAATNQISLFMCQGGSLKDAIVITGVKLDANGKPTGIKGTVRNKGSEGTQSWANSSTFNKGYDGAYLEVESKDKYSDTSNSGSFSRYVKLKLFDSNSEVSTVAMSSGGTWGGNAFKQKGVGKGTGDYGQALFTNSGTYSSQTFSWTHRSYFNISTGIVAGKTDSANFAEGGSLYVKGSEVPDYLGDSFSPDAPAGWDCSGADTVVDLDPDSAAHKACESGGGDGANCWGDDFEQSTEEGSI